MVIRKAAGRLAVPVLMASVLVTGCRASDSTSTPTTPMAEAGQVVATTSGAEAPSSAESTESAVGTPSAAAYCGVMNRYKRRYLDTFASANSNIEETSDPGAFVTGLLQALMATSELPSMFADMAKVAPPEIQSDTQRVADAYSRQLSNAADDPMNPGAALMKNLAVGMTVLGPISNVNSYVAEHCG